VTMKQKELVSKTSKMLTVWGELQARWHRI
jgi:hypothetical protein